MYKFYNANNEEITEYSAASDLASATQYTKTGSYSKDLIFICDISNHEYPFNATGGVVYVENGLAVKGGVRDDKPLYWGGVGTSLTGSQILAGYGKKNSEAALKIGVHTDLVPNMWGYLKYCRDNNLNGYSDWFIPTPLEIGNLPGTSASKYILESAEDGSTPTRWAYMYDYVNKSNSTWPKSSLTGCVTVVRSI